MTLKQFLKPDWRKILIFVILLIISTFIGYNEANCMSFGGGCTHSYGFPFTIYSIHQSAYMPSPLPKTTHFNPTFIIPNIIIWYLLSCLIIWIYDKFRKR